MSSFREIRNRAPSGRLSRAFGPTPRAPGAALGRCPNVRQSGHWRCAIRRVLRAARERDVYAQHDAITIDEDVLDRRMRPNMRNSRLLVLRFEKLLRSRPTGWRRGAVLDVILSEYLVERRGAHRVKIGDESLNEPVRRLAIVGR